MVALTPNLPQTGELLCTGRRCRGALPALRQAYRPGSGFNGVCESGR